MTVQKTGHNYTKIAFIPLQTNLFNIVLVAFLLSIGSFDVCAQEIPKRNSSIPIKKGVVVPLDTVKKIAHIDTFTEKIINKYWPGPLTLILELTDKKLKKSLNLDNKIAVRIPDSKCTLKLLEKCGLLVGTSANISGSPPFTDPKECLKNITNYDVFLNGGTITSKGESTIIEIENEEIKIIRKGVLKKEEIMI